MNGREKRERKREREMENDRKCCTRVVARYITRSANKCRCKHPFISPDRGDTLHDDTGKSIRFQLFYGTYFQLYLFLQLVGVARLFCFIPLDNVNGKFDGIQNIPSDIQKGPICSKLCGETKITLGHFAT